MERLRILLADDRPQILSLLQMVLEPDYTVVGTVEDGQSLIAAAQALRPDLVLTDIDMPILNGIEATRELRTLLPDCRVVVFSAHDEPDVMAAAFAAGASGYLIKGSSQSLLSSIRTIVQHVCNQGDNLLPDGPASAPPGARGVSNGDPSSDKCSPSMPNQAASHDRNRRTCFERMIVSPNRSPRRSTETRAR